MKLIISVALIVGFLTIAAFGTVAIGHGQMHNRAICIASAIQAIYCPDNFTSAAYFGFHLKAFNSFFTAVLGSNLYGAIASFAFFLSVVLMMLSRFRPLGFTSFVVSQTQDIFWDLLVRPFNWAAIGWIALHENSPSARFIYSPVINN